jgi:hypothetical protein
MAQDPYDYIDAFDNRGPGAAKREWLLSPNILINNSYKSCLPNLIRSASKPEVPAHYQVTVEDISLRLSFVDPAGCAMLRLDWPEPNVGTRIGGDGKWDD